MRHSMAVREGVRGGHLFSSPAASGSASDNASSQTMLKQQTARLVLGEHLVHQLLGAPSGQQRLQVAGQGSRQADAATQSSGQRAGRRNPARPVDPLIILRLLPYAISSSLQPLSPQTSL